MAKKKTDLKAIGEAILKVLEEWATPVDSFDAVWYGYNTLQSEINEPYTLRELKKAMKILSDEGKVFLAPIYDCDFNLAGRGWFLTETFN